ncbi:DUF3050 domain-containing protein [Bacillus sp. V3B]|uniref:DUF3050 domain-containing protein n=1 Tax=Bacillus sp. V3B TaxID=2804915 RepID=UPI002109F756|nr:DUF3050 domain-containing protein [Bacillus sp. V3B]MCQ6276322.1 DUF3050 domain-containing protein [Bacillus sp. V3B]
MTTQDLSNLESIRTKLVSHPIYQEITTPERVKVFMKHHVFAVWDFMCLLKRLQKSVTCVDVPWFPYEKPLFSRLINEIVVAEESDIDGKGGYSSHFSLYLEAMAECRANAGPFNSFLQSLKEGADYQTALAENSTIRNSIKDFVAFNLDLAINGEVYEVASAFFYGREGLIPEMFKPLVDSLMETGSSSERLVFYLNRHIEVDEDHHGPLAEKLLLELCENDPTKISRANIIGEKCLETRTKLWDGVLEEIKEKNL